MPFVARGFEWAPWTTLPGLPHEGLHMPGHRSVKGWISRACCVHRGPWETHCARDQPPPNLCAPTAVCPIPLQAHLSPPPCAPPPPSCSWACWPGGCRLPPAAAACRSVSLPCRLPCPQLLCVAHTPLAALRAERPVPLPVPLFSLPVHSTAMPAYPPRCPPAAAAAAPLCAPWPRRLSTASSWSSPTVSGGPAGLPTGVLPADVRCLSGGVCACPHPSPSHPCSSAPARAPAPSRLAASHPCRLPHELHRLHRREPAVRQPTRQQVPPLHWPHQPRRQPAVPRLLHLRRRLPQELPRPLSSGGRLAVQCRRGPQRPLLWAWQACTSWLLKVETHAARGIHLLALATPHIGTYNRHIATT